MIFEKLFLPDEMYPSFDFLTPEHMKELGRKYIFSDIDNTLVTYDDPEPTPAVLEWLEKMEKSGVTVSFVSNNNKERVERFNSRLNLVTEAKAGKPKIKALLRAMEKAGARADESVLLGDQLLTDCAAGKRAGLRCVIVLPIKDKKNLFFRSKRVLEIPYIKRYNKIHGTDYKTL